MTSRTLSHYTPTQIIERCACITLDDLLNRGAAITECRIETLSNALKTATAHECAVHLMEWPDGVLACIVSAGVKSFLDVSPAAKIAAYRKAVACGDVVYRDFGGVL